MKRSLLFIIVSIVLIILIRSFIITTFAVKGDSMQPALHDGDRVLVSLVEDLFHRPNSGDIVFFQLNKNDIFVKRLIARPGDYIAIHQQHVYVNGTKETKHPGNYNELLKIKGLKTQIVPDKCYIVLGDNANQSIDSRTFGCVDESQLIGKVITTYWHTNK